MDWRMPRHRFANTLLPALLPALLVSLSAATAHAESLEGKINAILGSDQLKGAAVGVSVVEVKRGGGTLDLYGHNAGMPLGPASNCKLLTTAAAFEKYGPHASFKTVLYRIGDDLVVVGGGDPGLGDAKLDADITAPFREWAGKLKKLGVTTYRDLIVDDRVFDNQWVHPNWPADQRLDWYSAPVGGLNFNVNCLDWRPTILKNGAVGVQVIPDTTYVSVVVKASRGKEMRVSMIRPADSNKFELRGTVSGTPGGDPYSVTIYDPGMWTGTILRDVLNENGVHSTGAVRRVGANEKLPSATLVAQHDTPLLAVMKRANKNSINMVAESFCKRLGHDATGQPGSWDNGPAAVMAFMKSIGVPEAMASLDDGSGLSSKNKVAAKAFTTVLAHVASRPDGDAFVSTLAEPGEDGTLKRRFRGLSVADFIHAKTGHIKGVSTLSGYIDVGGGGDNSNRRRFAFSILCNKYQGNVNPLQDHICQAIYDWAKQNP
jgi:D-alanyl-D-alanine carboxypeptidase/D-alanyl-D-alanine-endopeptidase (penicillin-binding protein 4)